MFSSGYTLRMKIKKMMAVLFLTFLFLISCGSGDITSPDGETESPLEIAVIPKGTTHEFWKSIHAGAQQAASETGVEILWKGPQKAYHIKSSHSERALRTKCRLGRRFLGQAFLA